MAKLMRWCGGRTYCFALLALGLGTWLASRGKLTVEFTALVTLLVGTIATRAVKQDRAPKP